MHSRLSISLVSATSNVCLTVCWWMAGINKWCSVVVFFFTATFLFRCFAVDFHSHNGGACNSVEARTKENYFYLRKEIRRETLFSSKIEISAVMWGRERRRTMVGSSSPHPLPATDWLGESVKSRAEIKEVENSSRFSRDRLAWVCWARLPVL